MPLRINPERQSSFWLTGPDKDLLRMLEYVFGMLVMLVIGAAVMFLFVRDRFGRAGRQRLAYAAKLEELGKLTGRLAHEIKNPLSTIKVNLDLTSEELQSLARHGQVNLGRPLRKIGVVKKECDRLVKILDGLARYADNSKPRLRLVDINGIVSDMIDFYLPKAHINQIIVRQSIAAEPLWCMVDVDLLKEVLLNLFINAGQAMSAGGELMVSTSARTDRALICVRDTGRGIESGHLNNIFEAYYSTTPGGSGLGLALAKKIINDHNGDISVASQPGKGTEFTIALKLCTDKRKGKCQDRA